YELSRKKIASKPSCYFKNVIANTKDNVYVMISFSMHAKHPSLEATDYHKLIEPELQEQLVLYLMNHNQFNLLQSKKNQTLAAELSNFLNYSIGLSATKNEVIIKQIKSLQFQL
ncbi:hypothetical protein MJH12_13990, partial [bacterium]|nr:hypothetical protein [bacterium]